MTAHLTAFAVCHSCHTWRRSVGCHHHLTLSLSCRVSTFDAVELSNILDGDPSGVITIWRCHWAVKHIWRRSVGCHHHLTLSLSCQTLSAVFDGDPSGVSLSCQMVITPDGSPSNMFDTSMTPSAEIRRTFAVIELSNIFWRRSVGCHHLTLSAVIWRCHHHLSCQSIFDGDPSGVITIWRCHWDLSNMTLIDGDDNALISRVSSFDAVIELSNIFDGDQSGVITIWRCHWAVKHIWRRSVGCHHHFTLSLSCQTYSAEIRRVSSAFDAVIELSNIFDGDQSGVITIWRCHWAVKHTWRRSVGCHHHLTLSLSCRTYLTEIRRVLSPFDAVIELSNIFDGDQSGFITIWRCHWAVKHTWRISVGCHHHLTLSLSCQTYSAEIRRV